MLVSVGTRQTLLLRLEVGGVTEQVLVSGAAPLIDTTRSEISGVVTARDIANLPALNRTFANLAMTMPEARPAGGFDPTKTRVGNFAMNEDVTLSGVVTKIDFVNPHSWVHFDMTAADGTKSQHRCELRSATTLRRSGWTPEMFAAGTRLTVQGSPDRVDPHSCYVSTLVFADGTTLDRYGQRIAAQPTGQRAARLPTGEPNLAGDWATEQLVMV